jgi:ABC-2 type transport system ATP-binding protein
LAGEGRAVLISSHLLAEADQTVDDVVSVARGHAVSSGTLAELGARGGHNTVVATPNPPAFAALAARRGWQLTGDPVGWAVTGPTAAQIGEAALAAGVVLHQLTPRGTSLESAFLRLTEGQGLA